MISRYSVKTEWYTPLQYTNSARIVLGKLDLDPASNAIANETVKAARYYDKEQDGLSQEWRGTVWLNPPYDGSVARWVSKLLGHYAQGEVSAAILLIRDFILPVWFRPLWRFTICHTRQRIKFITPNCKATSPPYGNIFVYLGGNSSGFATEFRQYGDIVKPYDY